MALVLVAAVAACMKKKEETTTTAPAAPTGGVTAGKVGVPECDDYISKYEKCVSGKVPEMARAALKSAFDQTVDEWKKAAATPEGKSGLATGCKMAMDAAKQSMGAYGCEW
jgi:hypothetical protein